jgi:hypothetical protein
LFCICISISRALISFSFFEFSLQCNFLSIHCFHCEFCYNVMLCQSQYLNLWFLSAVKYWNCEIEKNPWILRFASTNTRVHCFVVKIKRAVLLSSNPMRISYFSIYFIYPNSLICQHTSCIHYRSTLLHKPFSFYNLIASHDDDAMTQVITYACR